MNGDYILLNDGSILNLSNITRICKGELYNKEAFLIHYERLNGVEISEEFQKEEERNKKFDLIIKTFTLTLRK